MLTRCIPIQKWDPVHLSQPSAGACLQTSAAAEDDGGRGEENCKKPGMIGTPLRNVKCPKKVCIYRYICIYIYIHNELIRYFSMILVNEGDSQKPIHDQREMMEGAVLGFDPFSMSWPFARKLTHVCLTWFVALSVYQVCDDK